jgi:hypothetical protein
MKLKFTKKYKKKKNAFTDYFVSAYVGAIMNTVSILIGTMTEIENNIHSHDS